jgi:hypothetical protein
MASSGIEHETFRLVEQCLNQLRYIEPLNRYLERIERQHYYRAITLHTVDCVRHS